jgi:selenocysteine lyase/cysteine desulfurase
VLVDAAAFVPTNKLDLSVWKPDFVPISFYKMFGYPTGIGALLAKRSALQKLKRPWFAGGTITIASVLRDKYQFADGAPQFEDGTLDYLNIPAIEIGLRHIASIGYDVISTRVKCLTGYLMEELLALKHSNGNPLVKIYGPITMENRGGAVTINFYDKQGDMIDQSLIEKDANTRNISLRTGCFCNPGAGETAANISRDDIDHCFSSGKRLTIDDYKVCIDGKSVGAVRISVGLVTNFKDIAKVIELAKLFLS